MADIISPLPGVFYRSPSPDKDPYINEGDVVVVGQTIGMVEIMKQFSEIRSDVAGILVAFLVIDSGTVMPGAVIATIEES